jgi:hypothetical protein
LRPIHAKNRSTTQAPRVNGEADLIGVLAHDLDRNQCGLGDLLPSISAVGEDALDEREEAPRDSQKRCTTIAILDTSRASSTRPRPICAKSFQPIRNASPTQCNGSPVTSRSTWVTPCFYGGFTEGFDTRDLKEAKALLDEPHA